MDHITDLRSLGGGGGGSAGGDNGNSGVVAANRAIHLSVFTS